MVLYRNGVGYFERSGKVDGDVLTIKVRKDQVNDLLKSLTVVERTSGRAVSVSMPLDPQSVGERRARDARRPGRAAWPRCSTRCAAPHVTLETDAAASVRGRIVMVEAIVDEPDAAPPPTRAGRAAAAERATTRSRCSTASELRVVRLSKVHGVTLAGRRPRAAVPPQPRRDRGRGHVPAGRRSTIRLAGASVARPRGQLRRRGADVEADLPRRAARGGQGQALLQAWAVVDNTSGEDWRNVHARADLGRADRVPLRSAHAARRRAHRSHRARRAPPSARRSRRRDARVRRGRDAERRRRPRPRPATQRLHRRAAADDAEAARRAAKRRRRRCRSRRAPTPSGQPKRRRADGASRRRRRRGRRRARRRRRRRLRASEGRRAAARRSTSTRCARSDAGADARAPERQRA